MLLQSSDICLQKVVICYTINKNTRGIKKCEANQKQHCKQAGVTKNLDISAETKKLLYEN